MNIDGLIITELREIKDARGSVLHMMRNDSPEFDKFGECYFSEIFPGVVKAWKCHKKQTQNISVPVGRIRIVLFDSREVTSTKDKLEILELGRPDKYLRLQIPPGLWYGFKCISDVPALIANCANMVHDPDESDVRELDDSSIPYSWDNSNELMESK